MSAMPPSTCPRCNGELDRIRRRLVDRLVSLFAPCYRYRCRSLGCHWEGNLPRTSLDGNGRLASGVPEQHKQT